MGKITLYFSSTSSMFKCAWVWSKSSWRRPYPAMPHSWIMMQSKILQLGFRDKLWVKGRAPLGALHGQQLCGDFGYGHGYLTWTNCWQKFNSSFGTYAHIFYWQKFVQCLELKTGRHFLTYFGKISRYLDKFLTISWQNLVKFQIFWQILDIDKT